MTNKLPHRRGPTAKAAEDVEGEYQQLLDAFYKKDDRARARKIAKRLEAVLANRPDIRNSIRGDEVRAILAELRGDYTEAIRSRTREIRKIRQLHRLACGTPSWEYVLGQYDHSDLSDRLDLLAINYAEQGDLNRAIQVLRKSKRTCETHQIPFGGQHLLQEYEETRRSAPRESTNGKQE